MKAKKSNDPFWWALFGAGGTLSAFLLPVLVIMIGFAIPLGWITPSTEGLQILIASPWVRLGFMALISLSLFHWAHRFRFTLYDGLQIKHLNELIALMCYGTAAVLSGWALYWLMFA